MTEKSSDFDVIIVGAGPAGMSAAVWCSELGLKSVILERQTEPGGQLLNIFNPVNNYPGLCADNGTVLRDRFLDSVNRSNVLMQHAAEVTEIDLDGPTAITQNGNRYSGGALIFAAGVRRRRLNVPGESSLVGKGLIESGARDKSTVRGKTVAIVGGGDAALENAAILSEFASKVYVIHRRDKFRSRRDFIEKAALDPRIEFIFDTTVARIVGSDQVKAVELKDQPTSAARTLPVDAILIRIGVEPNSELLKDKVKLDPNGYILIDHLGRTSAPNVYAVGDVANPAAPTIATAVGTGATAAKHIRSS